MGEKKLNIEKRISMTRMKYFLKSMNLENDECREPNKPYPVLCAS